MLTERKKLALAGSLALALGLVVGGLAMDSDPVAREVNHVAIGSALAAGSAVGSASDGIDTKAYQEALGAERVADATAIDLLSAPVAPGAEVTTGVKVTLGKRVTGIVEYVGPSAASWETISVSHTDDKIGTWVEVKARNRGTTTARLIALVRLEATP